MVSGGQACVCVCKGREKPPVWGSGLCVCVLGTGEACMSVWGSGLCVCVQGTGEAVWGQACVCVCKGWEKLPV